MTDESAFALFEHYAQVGLIRRPEPEVEVVDTSTADECATCHKPLAVGQWPFCPHGHAASAVVQDEIPGGMWVENGFPEPIKVYSHSEHRRLLAERGLEIRAKWAGPADKHLSRMDIPCAQTLENAKILLSRGKTRAPEPEFERVPITVTEIRYEKPR